MVQVGDADTLEESRYDLEMLSWCTVGVTSNGSVAAEKLLGVISAASKRVLSLNEEARVLTRDILSTFLFYTLFILFPAPTTTD